MLDTTDTSSALPEQESAWSQIDWKPLLLGTAMAMNPQLKHMAPIFMRAFQQGTENAQAKQFAQGMMGVQKLMAEGKTEEANIAMRALADVTPKSMLGTLQKFSTGLQEQQQRQQFAANFRALNPHLTDDQAKFLEGMDPKDVLQYFGNKQYQQGGTVYSSPGPLATQAGQTQFIPQRLESGDVAKIGPEALAQLGFPGGAALANALNAALESGDMATVGKINTLIQSVPGLQAQFESGKKVGEYQALTPPAIAREVQVTDAKKAVELGYMPAETEQLANRAEATGYAGVVGKTAGEKFAFLTGRLDDKAGEYINVDSLEPAHPNMTGQQLVQSGKYRPMSQAQQKDLFEKKQAAQGYNQALGEFRKIVDANPELFPPKGKNIPAQASKALELYARGAIGEIDPKYAEVFSKLEALKAGAARYAKAWGDSGNVQGEEQVRQINAIGLKPGFKESTISRLDLLERMMSDPVNDYFKGRGLNYRLQKTGPLSIDEALEKARQLREQMQQKGNPR